MIDLTLLIETLGEKGHSPKEIAEIIRACTAPVPAYGMEMTTALAEDLKKSAKREADRARIAAKREAQRAAEEAERQSRDICDIARHRATSATVAAAKDAPAPTYTRGEDNPSRLVDTSSAVAAEAREPGSDWPPGKASDHAKILVAEAATVRLDMARMPDLVTTAGQIDAWKRSGASWEHDVLPVVVALARKPGTPIRQWKFFDPAITQSVADNRRALDIPEAAPRKPGTGPPRLTLAEQVGNESAAAKALALKALSAANG